MIRLIVVCAVTLFFSLAVNAQNLNNPGYNTKSPFETRDQARQRHSAERYQQYEQNNRQAPLGGYRDRLGDPAPVGTERPGFRDSRSSNGNSGYTPFRRR